MRVAIVNVLLEGVAIKARSMSIPLCLRFCVVLGTDCTYYLLYVSDFGNPCLLIPAETTKWADRGSQ